MLIPHLVSLLFTLALVPFTLSYSVSYDGDQVLRVPAGSTTSEAAHLRTVIDALGLQTWSHTIDVNKIVDVVVPAGQLGAFKAVLGGGRNYTVMHEDLGAAIRAESNKHSGNKDGDFSSTCALSSGYLSIEVFIYSVFFAPRAAGNILREWVSRVNCSG